jgi:hypothetical protein
MTFNAYYTAKIVLGLEAFCTIAHYTNIIMTNPKNFSFTLSKHISYSLNSRKIPNKT